MYRIYWSEANNLNAPMESEVIDMQKSIIPIPRASEGLILELLERGVIYIGDDDLPHVKED